MKVWGRLSSINVQKVVWCLDELDIAFERIDAGGAFGYPDGYEELNPNRLVPTVQDGASVRWESNAIVRYLCARHPERGLWPADPAARYAADRWMDWQTTEATPAIRIAFWQLIRTPPEERDADALARSTQAGAARAAILDRHLASSRFMAGETFTMGDIPIACHVHRWYRLPIERPALAHLSRWYDEVRARPGGRTVIPEPLR